MTRVTASRITSGQLVGEKIVSDVHASLARSHDHERGSKIRAHRTWYHSKQVYRVEVYLVSSPATGSDSHRPEGGAERARAGRLIIPDIEHEIVFDDVIVSAA